VAVEIYTDNASSDRLRAFAKTPGYQIVSERREPDDVYALKVEVSDAPSENDGISAIAGSGAVGRIRKLNETGFSVSQPVSVSRASCRPSPYFRPLSDIIGQKSTQLYELDSAQTERFASVSAKLNLKVTLYRADAKVLAEVPPSAAQTSLMFRLKRGDFGKVARMGVLADYSEMQSLHQSERE
jgi:hypothetical protein